MREDKNKVESIPARSGESRPRSSRSREAFRQRQKELAESRAQERRQQEGKAQADREKDNKAQTDQEKDNKAQEGWEAGDRETRNPDVQGNSPLPKILSWKAGAMVLLMAGIVLMGVYVYKALGYRNTYFPHTVINGMDVSGKTVEDVKGLMASGVNGYGLVLRLRGEEHEIITGDEIGLHTVFDGSLEEIIRQQNPFRWPRYLLKGPSYDIRTMIAYDDDALGQTLEGLSCFDSSRAVPPSDAYLSDYVRGQGYSIVPETEGTTLDMGKVREQAEQAISSLAPELDLDALGCYKAPSIRSDNSSLAAARDARNRYVNMTVTYTFGSKTEVLDGDEIHQWLVADGEQVSIDPDQAAAYVKSLGTRYNTAYTKRSFATSYGQSVEVSGFYGWRINQSQETKELLGILETGENVTREPVYLQTAASHDGQAPVRPRRQRAPPAGSYAASAPIPPGAPDGRRPPPPEAGERGRCPRWAGRPPPSGRSSPWESGTRAWASGGGRSRRTPGPPAECAESPAPPSPGPRPSSGASGRARPPPQSGGSSRSP